MEVFLNLCWAMLAVLATCLWLRHSRRTQSLPHRFCGLVALSCALLLLFPVISESDDLYACRAEMEDVTVKAGVTAKDLKTLVTHSTPTMSMVVRLSPSAEMPIVALVFTPAMHGKASSFATNAQPRSPPAVPFS